MTGKRRVFCRLQDETTQKHLLHYPHCFVRKNHAARESMLYSLRLQSPIQKLLGSIYATVTPSIHANLLTLIYFYFEATH